MGSSLAKNESCEILMVLWPELNIYINISPRMLQLKYDLFPDWYFSPIYSKKFFPVAFKFTIVNRNLMTEFHFWVYFLEDHFRYWSNCRNFNFDEQTIKNTVNLLHSIHFPKGLWLQLQTLIWLFKTKYAFTSKIEL